MRNILQYPITEEEVLTALDLAVEEQAAKKYIGDTMGYCLHLVSEHFKKNPQLLTDLVKAAALKDTTA